MKYSNINKDTTTRRIG